MSTLPDSLEPLPLSQADRAYAELRDRLVTLRIQPGEALRDEALGAELGVGRTPVREALKRLEHDRLVITYPRRGTFATNVDITDLRHITEVRRRLEPLAASAAAERATPQQRAHLQQLLGLIGDPGQHSDPGRLMDVDMTLHRALYDATNNPYLEDTLVHYDNLATRIWCLFLGRLPEMAAHVAEHEPLLRAVIDGDEAAAARHALAHLEHFEHAVRAAV